MKVTPKVARRLVGLLLLLMLVGAGLALLHRGMYGLTIFVLFPVVLGGRPPGSPW